MEFAVKVLPFDDSLQDELKKLEADGWQLVLGSKPVVVYQVGRMEKPAFGTEGGISIDETKIVVLRGGKGQDNG